MLRNIFLCWKNLQAVVKQRNLICCAVFLELNVEQLDDKVQLTMISSY